MMPTAFLILVAIVLIGMAVLIPLFCVSVLTDWKIIDAIINIILMIVAVSILVIVSGSLFFFGNMLLLKILGT